MDDAVQATYDTALQTLLAKVQTDSYILAVILLGSMSHDKVWRRSDIDIMLVTQETKLKAESFCLTEAGVNIHAYLATRSGLRKILEGSIQGSFMHSLLVKGRLLYSRDETVTELFEARHQLSAQDRSIQLLRMASWVLPCLAKAEKWFHAKRDFDYCSFWILKCVDPLASLELLLQGEIPAREVVQQALTYNPEFFRAIYTDLLHGQTTEAHLEKALAQIQTYLLTRAEMLFAPLLNYLQEEGELRSMTDINHYFARHYQLESVEIACEWLADEGLLQKFATPVRLTDKSKVSVEEAAYYFAEEKPS